MNTIIITTRSEKLLAGDLLDRGLDNLRTIHMALNPDNKGWLDDKTLLAIWASLDGVIRELEPLREALQNPGAHQGEEGGVACD
ncbi:hypothetical protein GRZ55_11700 [Chelativorans sp. ZYF759]|uniref:hypothetical protein n=1 Tax=Chelativorans sp. ZYF759 TaxID=2692213 RepID=UPI00145D467C|nr:hypothetical protein [Chelativorans sp. ZYF759]NMG39908.1 hypothetical protein [Chelativorans sp. ZYF759]